MASEDRDRVVRGSGWSGSAGSGSWPLDDRERAADRSSAFDRNLPDQPAGPLPRHLAVTRRTPVPGQVRSVLTAGLLGLAVVALGATVVVPAVLRSGVPGLHRTPATAAPSPARAAGTGRVPPSTLQRVHPVAGQPLVRGGSFEAGPVPRMRDRPGTQCRRVRNGAVGQWAMLLRATGEGPGPPGMWLDLASAPQLGSRWSASVWVRGHPGVTAQVRLYERRSSLVVGGDSYRLVLRDTLWHHIAVNHLAARPGSVLGVDLQVLGLRPGQAIAIDNLRATRTA